MCVCVCVCVYMGYVCCVCVLYVCVVELSEEIFRISDNSEHMIFLLTNVVKYLDCEQSPLSLLCRPHGEMGQDIRQVRGGGKASFSSPLTRLIPCPVLHVAYASVLGTRSQEGKGGSACSLIEIFHFKYEFYIYMFLMVTIPIIDVYNQVSLKGSGIESSWPDQDVIPLSINST